MNSTGFNSVPFVDIEELSQRSRFSVSTLRRLVRDRKIPFYQPSGKGGRLLFPADAIERAAAMRANEAALGNTQDTQQRLSGPPPAWQRRKSHDQRD